MARLNKNSKGFGVIEALLVLVIVCLVVFAGYYVWHTNKNDKSSQKAANDATTSAKSNTRTGWKSYTLKNEKVSFKYPSGWKLQDGSDNKSDMVQLTNTSNFTILISTGGLGHPSSDAPTKVYKAEPITVVSRAAYLDFVGRTDSQSQSKQLVYEADVSKSATKPLDTLPSEASGENSSSNGNLVITLLYGTHDNPNGQPLANILSSKNTTQAKQILASMHY